MKVSGYKGGGRGIPCTCIIFWRKLFKEEVKAKLKKRSRNKRRLEDDDNKQDGLKNTRSK